jgi:hypothetical protein
MSGLSGGGSAIGIAWDGIEVLAEVMTVEGGRAGDTLGCGYDTGFEWTGVDEVCRERFDGLRGTVGEVGGWKVRGDEGRLTGLVGPLLPVVCPFKNVPVVDCKPPIVARRSPEVLDPVLLLEMGDGRAVAEDDGASSKDDAELEVTRGCGDGGKGERGAELNPNPLSAPDIPLTASLGAACTFV